MTLDVLEARERIDEIAGILAAGLMRLRARKSSQILADSPDRTVDCEEVWSGHPADREAEMDGCHRQ